MWGRHRANALFALLSHGSCLGRRVITLGSGERTSLLL